jgi:hypothetical protein
MLSKCEIHNVDGTTVYPLDSNPNSAGFSALTAFNVEVQDRTITDRTKMQARGVWRTFSYEGGMTIDIEGTLQANSPANVLTQLALLTASLRGLPTDTITVRKRGFIKIRRLDATEDWQADFTVLGYTPKVSAETTVIPYMITLFCWDPYFTGSGTSGLYYW